MDSLFETGSVVELSDLKYKFSAKLTKLRNALYDDAIDEGWFSRRPDHVRVLWRGVGHRGARRRHRHPRRRHQATGGDSRRSPSRSSAAAPDALRRQDAASHAEGHRDVQPHRGLPADLRHGTRRCASSSPSGRTSSPSTCRSRSSTAARRSGPRRSRGSTRRSTQSTSTWYMAGPPVHRAGVRRHDGGLLDERHRHALCQHTVVVGWQRLQRRLLRWWRRRRWRRQLVSD